MYNPETVKILLCFLSNEIKANIESFVEQAKLISFPEYNNLEDIAPKFAAVNDVFLNSISHKESEDLLQYTGYFFKWINAVLRDNWNYEDHGLYDAKKAQEYRELAKKVEEALYKYPDIDFDLTTYRGVNINVFARYGVSQLKDLNNLKDSYLYDEAFTSTSILQSSSFFNRKLDNGINYNVLIKYRIVQGQAAGALLSNKNVSYAVAQNEFVINSGSLSRVLNVQIDETSQTAVLEVLLIPTMIWDPQRLKQKSQTAETRSL